MDLSPSDYLNLLKFMQISNPTPEHFQFLGDNFRVNWKTKKVVKIVGETPTLYIGCEPFSPKYFLTKAMVISSDSDQLKDWDTIKQIAMVEYLKYWQAVQNPNFNARFHFYAFNLTYLSNMRRMFDTKSHIFILVEKDGKAGVILKPPFTFQLYELSLEIYTPTDPYGLCLDSPSETLLKPWKPPSSPTPPAETDPESPDWEGLFEPDNA